jgi:O-acetyl-ADP-ribose deacetylase (regulator of RNase III)
MDVVQVTGDLLDQDVEAIVNAWNRNFIPWWLLLPQGVSGAIRKRAGTVPFREVRRFGLLDVGQAVETSAGRLPFKYIIHVAGLHAYWVASERSVRTSTRNALELAERLKVRSLAFPVIGGGTGGASLEKAVGWMLEELEPVETSIEEVRLVRYETGRG